MPIDLWKIARLLGAAALVAGPFVVHGMLPDRAVPWERVTELRVSPEDCLERREERQESMFTLPLEHPEPVTWERVAHWFRLDPNEVCAVNGVGRAACPAQTLAPGEELALPLLRHAAGPPGRGATSGAGE